jgi:drug/metabolite transporter (DMT)-like permease
MAQPAQFFTGWQLAIDMGQGEAVEDSTATLQVKRSLLLRADEAELSRRNSARIPRILQAPSLQIQGGEKDKVQMQSFRSRWREKLLVPAVLSLLVVQNACQMLSMRYTKVSGGAYLSSTAVVVSEILKVAACLVILAAQHRGNVLSVVYSQVILDWKDTLMVSIPALIYVMQNNLLYVAASNLDAATCQITYQLKILTTALFAVGMMGKELSTIKWFSLCVLVAGVALVQVPKAAAVSSVGNPAVGLASVLCACFMRYVSVCVCWRHAQKSYWIRESRPVT